MSVDLTIPREYKRRAEVALPGRVAKIVLYGRNVPCGSSRYLSEWRRYAEDPFRRYRTLLTRFAIAAGSSTRRNQSSDQVG